MCNNDSDYIARLKEPKSKIITGTSLNNNYRYHSKLFIVRRLQKRRPPVHYIYIIVLHGRCGRALDLRLTGSWVELPAGPGSLSCNIGQLSLASLRGR